MCSKKKMLGQFILLTIITVSETSESDTSVQIGNQTDLPTNISNYQLSSEKTAMVVVGLSTAALAIMYLPALIYRVFCLLGGCQSNDFRMKREDFTSLLGTARDIRVNKRSAFEGSILERLAKGQAKYAREDS